MITLTISDYTVKSEQNHCLYFLFQSNTQILLYNIIISPSTTITTDIFWIRTEPLLCSQQNLSKSLQIFQDSTTHQGTHIWHPSGSMGWCAQGWSYWWSPQNSMSRDPFWVATTCFFHRETTSKMSHIDTNRYTPQFLIAYIIYILYYLIIFACSTNFYHVISMFYVNMLFCYSMNRDAGQWSYCDPRFWRIDPVFRLVHLWTQVFLVMSS